MKSAIKLTSEFGHKVFVHGRGWIKRDELQEPVKELGLIRLEELEKKIIHDFFDAAEALKEIKEKKLYLQVAETFKQYCEERLGKSVRACYEHLKMLEISGTSESSENVHTVHKRPLAIKDLRKIARIPAQKRLPNPSPMPSPIAEKDNGDLLAEIMDRIQAHADNENFLNALKEWLDESGI